MAGRQELARFVVEIEYLRKASRAGGELLPVGRLAILACVAFVASAAWMCQASDIPAKQLPLLTTARQVHDLRPDQASLGYPVRLRGVVTFYDAYQEGHRALFIADNTGEVFVAPGSAPLLPLHAGSLVEVTGETDPGGFSPIVSHSIIRILPGLQRLPTAAPVTVSQLLSGGKDSDWVALEGVVRSVEFDGMHVVLTVAASDGTLSATTDKEDGANYSALVDSDIVIRGINAPLVNARRQLTGVRNLSVSGDEEHLRKDTRFGGSIFTAHSSSEQPLAILAAPCQYASDPCPRTRDTLLARASCMHCGQDRWALYSDCRSHRAK